jgi:hypothetical protein
MQIDLDSGFVRHMLETWRMATDIELAMDDRLKIQLIARRGEILAKFVVAARAWLLLLRSSSSQQSAELNALAAEVLAFQGWAQGELETLRQLRREESVLDQ